MNARSTAASPAPHIVMIVGNDVTADTRVKKMAVAVGQMGLRVTVVCLSPSGTRTEGQLGPARIIRMPVLFSLRNHRRQRTNRLRRRFTLGYATKDDYVVARRRRKVVEREITAAAGRALARLEARQAGESPTGLHQARRKAVQLQTKARRLAVKPRRKVVQIREGLYRRRLQRRGGVAGSGKVQLSKLINRIPLAADWRRLLPEIDDYELSFGPAIDELQPDIIHAHDVHMIGIAERAAARARLAGRQVKWVYDAHEYVPGLARYTPRVCAAYADLEREYIKAADCVITVSEPLAEELQRSFDLPRRPAVVMNIPVAARIEGPEAPSVRLAAGLDPDVPLVVYSGGINPSRGVDTLVEALPLLPGVHAALVTKADSNYVRSLEAIAEKTGCRNRLHIVPFVAPDEVATYLSSATVGVSTLTHYGNHEVALPNKYFEYLHAGLPVVVSGVKAMADLTRELGIGEVFKAGDPEDLAQAVRQVLADRDRYTRPLRDHPEILERFSWERQEDVLRGVYQELLSEFEGLSRPPAVSVASLAETTPTHDHLVVGIGPRNMAGQAWAWAKAIEHHMPGVSTEVFALKKRSPLVFPADRRVPVESWKSLEWQLGQVRYVLETYSHLLLEAGSGVFGTLNGGLFDGDLPALRARAIAVGLVFHGTEVRDPRLHRKLEPYSPYADEASEFTIHHQHKVDRLLALVERFEGPRFVTTMDLMDYVPDARWLPVVVDPRVWTGHRPPLQRRRPVVVHAPSHDQLKGSASVDLVAEELDARGLIEYRRLRSVAVDEMPAAIKDADVVLDQFALGDYGVMACQAMAAGRLVIGHVGDRVRERIPDELPILEATSDSLREIIEEVCDDRERAQILARRGQDYVTRFHDGTYAVRQLAGFLAPELRG